MLRLTVNRSRCTSCRFCESVCAFGHYRETLLRKSRIRVSQAAVEEPSYTINVCRQCSTCPPLKLCPTGALTRDPETGILHLDPQGCPSGCRICADACHLGAFHDGGDRLILCDLCGGDPECVRVCYTEALFLSEYQLTERGMGKRQVAEEVR